MMMYTVPFPWGMEAVRTLFLSNAKLKFGREDYLREPFVPAVISKWNVRVKITARPCGFEMKFTLSTLFLPNVIKGHKIIFDSNRFLVLHTEKVTKSLLTYIDMPK